MRDLKTLFQMFISLFDKHRYDVYNGYTYLYGDLTRFGALAIIETHCQDIPRKNIEIRRIM